MLPKELQQKENFFIISGKKFVKELKKYNSDKDIRNYLIRLVKELTKDET